MVLRILRRSSTPSNQYEIIDNALFTVTTKPELRNPPSPPLTPEEIQKLNLAGASDDKIPIEPLTHSEKWNQYRIISTDEVLRVKMILIDLFRLPDKYDDLGEQMYWFTTGNVIAPLPVKGDKLTP